MMLKSSDFANTSLKAKGCQWLHEFSAFLLLAVTFWIVSAASFSGYISKWALLDHEKRNSVQMMLDGTAHRPFVYRQLVPAFANFANAHLPAGLKQAVIGKHDIDKIYGRASGFADPGYQFRYLIIYYASFLALFASMFVLRRILLDHDMRPTLAILAPVGLALALPYIQTIGGYFYDNIEILSFALAFLLSIRGRIVLLFLLMIPATLNKETFFFYLPTLYPLVRANFSTIKSATSIGICILLSGVVNLVVKYAYAENPGMPAEIHLWTNLKNYVTPWFYRETEITYGLIGPARLSLITIMIIAIIVWRGWKECSIPVRQHVLIAAVINVPLFLVFAETGELRNLSLLFVGMTIMLAKAVQHIENRQLASVQQVSG